MAEIEGVVAISDPEWPNALLIDERHLEDIINYLNYSNEVINAESSYAYIKKNCFAVIDLEDQENKLNVQVMPLNDLFINEDDNYKAYSCCFKCSLGFIDYSDQPDHDYKHVFVYQDDLTKFTILRPLKEKEGREILQCLLEIFSLIGVPAKLYTQEKSLVKSLIGKEVGEFCQDFTTKIKEPKTQDFEQTECHRFDKQIKKWMTSKNSAEWSKGLYLIQFQNNSYYNNVIHAVPFRVLLNPGYTYYRKKYTRYFIQKQDQDMATEPMVENFVYSSESNIENDKLTKTSELFNNSNELEEEFKELKENNVLLKLEIESNNENNMASENPSKELTENDIEAKKEDEKISENVYDEETPSQKSINNNILLSSDEPEILEKNTVEEEKSAEELVETKEMNAEVVTDYEEEVKITKNLINQESDKENIQLAKDINILQNIQADKKTSALMFKMVPPCDKTNKLYLKVMNERDNSADWYECDMKHVDINGEMLQAGSNSKMLADTSSRHRQNICLVCKKKKLRPRLKPEEKNFSVGSTVRVRVPVMERQRGHPNYILGVIAEERANGEYIVATPYGILKESFRKDQLSSCNHNLFKPNELNSLQQVEISKALICQLQSPTDKELIRCTCKKDLGFCNPRFTYHSKCYTID